MNGKATNHLLNALSALFDGDDGAGTPSPRTPSGQTSRFGVRAPGVRPGAPNSGKGCHCGGKRVLHVPGSGR